MRILLHDYGGYSFIYQLSVELAERGHDVTHIFFGSNNVGAGFFGRREEIHPNLSVIDLGRGSMIEKRNLFKRWIAENEYGKLISDCIDTVHPDILISANSPLDVQRRIVKICKSRGIKIVYWLQDLIGKATESHLGTKTFPVGKIVSTYYSVLEIELLKSSDAIVVASPDFVDFLRDAKLRTSNVFFIPNWSNFNEITVRPKNNKWAVENGLADKFCFMYTGSIGFKHQVDLFFKMATYFRKYPSVRIVIVGGGALYDVLKIRSLERGFENISIFPFQPLESYPETLGAADVLIGMLTPDASKYSVPSKVLSYLSAGKPILYLIDSHNFAARVIQESLSGWTIDSNQVEPFLKQAEAIFLDPDQLRAKANSARRYAEKEFDIVKIADKFESIVVNRAVLSSEPNSR